MKHAEESIPKAVASGRLSPEAAARAQENVDKGNVTIVTGWHWQCAQRVIERIVGGERACRPPEAEAMMPRVFEPEKRRQLFLDFYLAIATKFEPETTGPFNRSHYTATKLERLSMPISWGCETRCCRRFVR